jgi:hypothetical protein
LYLSSVSAGQNHVSIILLTTQHSLEQKKLEKDKSFKALSHISNGWKTQQERQLGQGPASQDTEDLQQLRQGGPPC